MVVAKYLKLKPGALLGVENIQGLAQVCRGVRGHPTPPGIRFLF